MKGYWAYLRRRRRSFLVPLAVALLALWLLAVATELRFVAEL